MRRRSRTPNQYVVEHVVEHHPKHQNDGHNLHATLNATFDSDERAKTNNHREKTCKKPKEKLLQTYAMTYHPGLYENVLELSKDMLRTFQNLVWAKRVFSFSV